MHRCMPSLFALSRKPCARSGRTPARPVALLLATFALCGGLCALPVAALAQNDALQATPASLRNFPESALRGKLVVTGMYNARLDGKPIRMAPGMRLFSPQNSLVQAHTVLEKPLTVNYVLENSTGMLLTAWILSKDEAAQKRPGASGRSFLWFGAD